MNERISDVRLDTIEQFPSACAAMSLIEQRELVRGYREMLVMRAHQETTVNDSMLGAQGMAKKELLSTIDEARMHMHGRLSSPGAREITDGRLAVARAAIERLCADLEDARRFHTNEHKDRMAAEAERDELGIQVFEGKLQWNCVATTIGANGDDVDDVFSKAKELSDLWAMTPRVNIKCVIEGDGIGGSTDLRVLRVEREDDGSYTAVTDFWPHDPPAPAGAASAKASRYDWKDAPEWAMWMATDADGVVYRFEHKPDRQWGSEEWIAYGGRTEVDIASDDLPCPDWRDSLEPRPAADGGVE